MLTTYIRRQSSWSFCKTFSSRLCWVILLALPCSLFSSRSTAQIIPDNTLLNNSIVVPNGNSLTINGGTTSGGNLFHSFREFSIPTGSEAFFDNAGNVKNIFNRVTGEKVSNIDGLIRANGTANLFFINPNGLIFGQNAKLNIGGSFIASTADSILFSDGNFFSATSTKASPLLTVNVPIGLQFGQNPGVIQVQGTGHGFTSQNATIAPINRGESMAGLRVKPNQTLALVGGDINLFGGTLTAESGRVELGSVSQGKVRLSQNAFGWTFGYEEVQSFRDIILAQQSVADVSGNGDGNIELIGRQITLRDSSIALNQNRGEKASGEIRVNAEYLELVGASLNAKIRSGLLSENLSSGTGGNIVVSTNQLAVLDGAQILSKTFSSATGGGLNVNATQAIEVSGFPGIPNVFTISPDIFTFVGAITVNSGNGGDVRVSTRQLRVLNGGTVSAPTYSSGKGGNVTLNVSDLVEVSGFIPEIAQPSSIGSATAGRENAGNLTINTSTVVVEDGGFIVTSTLASGSAGNITINASNSIKVSGIGGAIFPSAIDSSGIIAPEIFRRLRGLPDVPSGNSGTVTINTPRLTIADGARVSAANQGTGIAGNLNINAGSILLLDSGGGITAATASGEGGNINITTDFLQLRRASQISTQAGGTGNGGNLTINANTFAILEGSEVNANAFQGTGGNIQINSQGLFASPDSQITASSQLGVSGTININSPEVNTTGALIELPQNPVDPTQQVVAACTPDKNNSFTVAGRGGLSEDPTLPISSFEIWADWNDYTQPTFRSTNRRLDSKLFRQQQPPLVEATSWRVNANGQVELYANVSDASNYITKSSCR